MIMKKMYDVVIAGGGTAGCACAYICGKYGLKTLLIEKQSFLGGSITSSLVVPAMKTADNSINNDFFDELHKKLKSVNGVITYSDGNKGWFNPELTKITLDKMMKEANVEILFEHNIKDINEKLSEYTISIYDNNSNSKKGSLLPCIDARYIVDATGDAKICELMNFDFLENKNNNQPINLRFIMSGVNTDKFAQWLMSVDKDTDVSTACKIEGYTYVSTAYTWDKNKEWALRPYFAKAIADGVLTEEDCNYFQLFSVAGTPDSIAFNAPRLLNGNLTRTEAYIQGREIIYKLSVFCKKYLPGFENSYISSIANTIGTRVSNRIKGKYVYTKDDLISGKKFDNPAVISNYPIDIHSSDKDKSVLQKIYQEYQLPIESLIVKDNFFVVGRCLSAEFEAQAALRIIPSCFSMGEAVAKYIAGINHQNC